MKSNPVVDNAIENLRSHFASSGDAPDYIVDLATLVANADGQIDEMEKTTIRAVLSRALGREYPQGELEELTKSSLEAIEAVGAASRARAVGATLASNDVAEAGVRCALAIAFSSEGLSDDERSIIEQIAHSAGVPLPRLQLMIEEVRVACELGELARPA